MYRRPRHRRRLVLLAAAGACASAIPVAAAQAADVIVRDNAELISAINAAQPGDSIILRNGIWNDVNLNNRLIPNASPTNPIHIRAQTPGQVVITSGGSIFDVRGSGYTVSGLAFKDQNETLKAVRFRGTHARVFDNAILNFGRYNQILWDVQDSAANPTSSFDHNVLAGKKDRGVSLVLDGSLNAQIKNNYFGHRDRGGPSGQTNGWETIRIGVSSIMDQPLGAIIERNYFDGTEGEQETISDKTRNNIIRGNTFRDITVGRVTARHGGGSTYEQNYFINALGIRVGNTDDAIPDHPGLTIRNNYMEGPNAKIVLPGYQTTPTIENNTIVVTSGPYVSGEGTVGKHPLEYHNTTDGVIANNVLAINDGSYAAVQARTLGGIVPTASGGGNVAWDLANGTNTFTSGVPTAMRGLFDASNPNLVRDADGILRPTGTASGKGFTGTGAPLTRASTDIGPSWLDPVMRLNKFTALEIKFDGDLSGGAIDATANNSGYLVTPAVMRDNSGAATNRHTSVTGGVSAAVGDRAFDNRDTPTMGAPGGGRAVADNREWFRNLQALTITGWFKTDGQQSIGNGASLIEQIDSSGGWALLATQTGRLTLTIHDGSTSTSVTSDAAFEQQDEWTFFAVRFDQRPSSNEVEFFVGTEASDVASAGVRSLARTASADGVAPELIIGNGFDGLIDNVRLFGARRSVTWVDEDGSVYTRTASNHEFALLNLDDLRTVRAFDLTPFEQSWAQRWNADADGVWTDSNNWLGGDVPNFTDAVVNFTGAIGADRTVTLEGVRTAGIVSFDNANRYTLAGAGTLVLDVSRGSAELNVVRGQHTIATDVSVLDDTAIFTANPDSVLTLSGGVTAAAGVSLTKRGPGRLEVRHVRAESLGIEQGTVAVLPNGTPAGTSNVKSLSLAPGATLDIGDNAVVIDYTGPSPLPTIRAHITAAFNGGAWDQPGITSSLADASHFGVGYAEASDVSHVPEIFGDVDSTAVLLRLARYGDANLDGVVNLADFNRLAANFGSTGALWSGGDFNYDGVVNLIDFNRLAANFGLSASGPDVTPQDWAALASAVPEPSGAVAGAASLGALLLARRRRR